MTRSPYDAALDQIDRTKALDAIRASDNLDDLKRRVGEARQLQRQHKGSVVEAVSFGDEIRKAQEQTAKQLADSADD